LQVATKMPHGHEKKRCVPNKMNATCLPKEKLGAIQWTMCPPKEMLGTHQDAGCQ